MPQERICRARPRQGQGRSRAKRNELEHSVEFRALQRRRFLSINYISPLRTPESASMPVFLPSAAQRPKVLLQSLPLSLVIAEATCRKLKEAVCERLSSRKRRNKVGDPCRKQWPVEPVGR